MQMSENGIKFLTLEEGVKLYPYLDSAGVATIGIGSTRYEDGRSVKMTDKPITLAEAKALFKNTLKGYEAQVNKSIPRPINQNQFDALVSLCYNIGKAGFSGSTVAKRVNKNPCDPTIREAIERWRFAGGEPILLGRRKREANLYFS